MERRFFLKAILSAPLLAIPVKIEKPVAINIKDPVIAQQQKDLIIQAIFENYSNDGALRQLIRRGD